jgi:two-component system, NtrC family, response regulator HydG
MSRVLIVEPDDAVRTSAREHLENAGYTLFEAGDTVTAELLLVDQAFDVVVGDATLHEGRLLDLVFENNVGESVALLILLTEPDSDVVVDHSVSGPAFDYLQKPFALAELEHRVKRAVEFKRIHYEAQSLRGERNLIYRPENFIGESEPIRQILSLISKVAMSGSSVLLTGETGTGKELVAGAIHYNSPRAGNAFVKVNCAALPDDLLESELFGHEKGAFTGAVQRRIGRFEHADGGSIFLDEIGDMSLVTQAKVLRVIQEKEFERIGGNKTISSDVRIISATNKNLPNAIETGAFRQDLFYRLNVVSVNVPPLRERGNDVLLLAQFFLKKFSADLKKHVRRVHPLAMEVLKDHAFPGNVRELQNLIERGVLMCDGDEIMLEDLDISFQKKGAPADENVVTMPRSGLDLKQVEKSYILQALRLCEWNQREAAKLLNVTPRTLNYKIKNHGITHLSWSQNKPAAGASIG